MRNISRFGPIIHPKFSSVVKIIQYLQKSNISKIIQLFELLILSNYLIAELCNCKMHDMSCGLNWFGRLSYKNYAKKNENTRDHLSVGNLSFLGSRLWLSIACLRYSKSSLLMAICK